jgi:hypothetical protein
VSIERRVVIADKILCAFLQAIIKLVEKLDLGTTEKKCPAGILEVIPFIHLKFQSFLEQKF